MQKWEMYEAATYIGIRDTAKLIEAAPEMLDALKDGLAFLPPAGRAFVAALIARVEG